MNSIYFSISDKNFFPVFKALKEGKTILHTVYYSQDLNIEAAATFVDSAWYLPAVVVSSNTGMMDAGQYKIDSGHSRLLHLIKAILSDLTAQTFAQVSGPLQGYLFSGMICVTGLMSVISDVLHISASKRLLGHSYIVTKRMITDYDECKVLD